MAYRDTHLTRLKKLALNPRQEIKNVLPFIKSKSFPVYRRFLELLGNYSLSKPFSGHDRFIKHINFKNGFFVQCGGMDGYGNDPTYYLEKRLGWKGIIVEPLPVYKMCQKNRSASTVYNCAVGSFGMRNQKVPFVDCYGMSFVKGAVTNEAEWIGDGERTQRIKAKTIEVTLRPIQDIIDEYDAAHQSKRDIDLFVVDVEGYEMNVLNGLDFNKNKPKHMLLEIGSAASLQAVESLLQSHKYHLVEKINNDYFFILNDLSPPNTEAIMARNSSSVSETGLF